MFRFLSVLSLLGISILQAGVFDWGGPSSSRGKKAQEVMKNLEPKIEKALIDYQVPGLAVGVVVDGELIYAKGFGVRDLEKKLPVTPHTLFPIGSCTKAFTSFLIGMYVDEGLVGWDQPLVDVISDVRLWNYDVTYLLTFRDVLTHRSGLPRHEFLWYNAKIEREELLKKFQFLEPAAPFRHRYIYNNLMYLAAGIALEKLTHKTWEEQIKEKILQPLSMGYTNFSVQEMQNHHDHAVPYLERNQQLKKMAFRDLSLIGPAGSINSNVEDLAHWVQMYLAGGVYKGQRLIQSAHFQEMLLPQILITDAPEVEDANFDSYGIGWKLGSYRGHYLAHHHGISDGFTSMVAFLPKENIGVIFLCNKNMTVVPSFAALQALDAILGLSFKDHLQDGLESLKKTQQAEKENSQKEDPTRKMGTFPSHPLEDYTGEYEHPAYGLLTVDLVEGKLRILYNDIPLILEHWHYDVFSIAEEPDLIIPLKRIKIAFQANVRGEIAFLSAPLEPLVKDIVFKRKQQVHSALPYLARFTGLYEVYGYSIEVVLRGGALVALIPGQPIYEMVPLGENEFSVKSKTGYHVRFILDDKGLVAEVLLIQPYGTFAAKPKHASFG